MAKRIFKFGSIGQGGVGWIGDRFYSEPCVIEFDDDDPDDAAHIKLLEKSGNVVVELMVEPEPEPEPEEPEIDIGTMTIAELRSYAKENKIPFTMNMKKAQLFEVVSDYVEAE